MSDRVGARPQINARTYLLCAKESHTTNIIKVHKSLLQQKTGELPGHTKPIFKEHSLLTVHNIIYMQTLVLLQKAFNNVTPVAICSLFEINTHQPKPTQLRSVKEVIYFKIPLVRKTALDNTIFVKGPKMYNKAATNFNRSLMTFRGTIPLI